MFEFNLSLEKIGCIIKASYCMVFHCIILYHDDIIKWKHFPHYWPFVWGIHGHRWIPPKRPVTWSFDVFFDLRLNKRLSKQSCGWWFEMPLRSLWRHCNVVLIPTDSGRGAEQPVDVAGEQRPSLLLCQLLRGELCHNFNSVAHERCGFNVELVIFISMINILSISCEIALRWMPQDLTDD